jgi:hypothetical protein
MKELVLNITADGTINSLWHDMLSGIAGNKTITRASNVEFDNEAQGWIVTIETGIYKGCCIPKIFTERSKAIDAEIDLFNSTVIH